MVNGLIKRCNIRGVALKANCRMSWRTRMTTANQSATQHVHNNSLWLYSCEIQARAWAAAWAIPLMFTPQSDENERGQPSPRMCVCIYVCMCVCVFAWPHQRPRGMEGIPCPLLRRKEGFRGRRAGHWPSQSKDEIRQVQHPHSISLMRVLNMALFHFNEKPLFIITTNKFCFSVLSRVEDEWLHVPKLNEVEKTHTHAVTLMKLIHTEAHKNLPITREQTETKVCVYVSVCVWDRDRERERLYGRCWKWNVFPLCPDFPLFPVCRDTAVTVLRLLESSAWH